METKDIVALVIVIVLVIYSGVMATLAAISWSGLRGCETTENPNCPAFFCANADTATTGVACASRAFRYDATGKKQCQYSNFNTYYGLQRTA